jgi:hypothetical protein
MIKRLIFKSRFHYTAILFLLLFLTVLVIGIPGIRKHQEDAVEGMRLPAIGTWNGFNGHMLVLECSNHRKKKVEMEVVVKDQENNVIGVEELSILGEGTVHTILNKYSVSNAYGTLEIDSREKHAAISCRSITYRMNEDEEVQYATSTALGEILSGTSYGVYNSMNPDGNIRNPVYNWLTIYNPETTPFNGRVLLRSQDGTPLFDKQIFVSNLPPGGRMDYAVGHPDGQVVGIFEVIPEDSTKKYGAFLSRYSEVSPGVFSFSMNIPSSRGMLDSGMVPASSMGPAINWAEVANISPESASITLEVFNRNAELLYSTSKTLSPYSQFHEFLNAHIGELNVGFFRVKSTGKVLVQSLYYGQDVNDPLAIQWAYNTTGGFPEFLEASFPVNTNLNAPNWLKVFGGTLLDPVPVTIRIFNTNGTEVSIENEGRVLVHGSADIPLHQYTGTQFSGKVVIKADQPVQAELVRVFTSGGGNAARSAMRAKDMKEISGRRSPSQSGINYMMNISPLQDGSDDEDSAEVSCRGSYECPEGMICSGGTCIEPGCGFGSGSGSCPEGQVCVSGRCEQLDCSNGQPCPEGQVCINGTCDDGNDDDDDYVLPTPPPTPYHSAFISANGHSSIWSSSPQHLAHSSQIHNSYLSQVGPRPNTPTPKPYHSTRLSSGRPIHDAVQSLSGLPDDPIIGPTSHPYNYLPPYRPPQDRPRPWIRP